QSEEVLSRGERDARQCHGAAEREERALIERLRGNRRCHQADKHGDRASQADESCAQHDWSSRSVCYDRSVYLVPNNCFSFSTCVSIWTRRGFTLSFTG